MPRRVADAFERRKYLYFPVVALLTLAGIVYGLHKVRGLSFNDVFFVLVGVVSGILFVVESLLKSFMTLFFLVILWKFKDNVLRAFGVENTSHILGDWRDWLTCWSMMRFEPVDMWIWKVTDLPSAKMASENHLFCAVAMGYNPTMRTRVRNGAGNSCVMKERLQFNFDPLDLGCSLTITVMTQGVIGSTEIGKVTVSCTQLNQMLERSGPDSAIPEEQMMVTTAHTGVFGHSQFVALDLIPAGRIWIRFGELGRINEHTSLWATATT